MEEIWKIIPGFSRYEASNTGFLRSVHYKNGKSSVILKPAFTKCGYLKTMLLGDDKKYHSWCVHTFVALTFLGKKPENLQINHKDGQKTNNKITNLEYVTLQQNVTHAKEMGLQKYFRGSENGASKLTEEQVIEIRNYVKNFKGRYYGRKELAKKYNISECHIKEIVNRRRNTWAHV